MKLKIIAFFLSVVCAYAVPTGTVYKMVQVDTNGVIVKPANFIAANAIVTGTVSTVETDPVFTNSVAGRITLADTNAWYTGSGGGLLDVTASGGILVGSGGGSTRDIGLTTNALTNAAIQAGLVTASITNPLSDRVSVIDTGKVSQSQGVALTNDLRGDIAAGVNFTNTPTVNGNPVLTNAAAGVDTTALDLAGTRPMTGNGVTLARDVKSRDAGIVGECGVAFGTNTVAGNGGAAFGSDTIAGVSGAAFGNRTVAGNYGAAFGADTTTDVYGATFGDATVAGSYGFSAGRRGKGFGGSFVFSDSQNADFDRLAFADAFSVRASGGTYFDTPDMTITGTVTAGGMNLTAAIGVNSNAITAATNTTRILAGINSNLVTVTAFTPTPKTWGISNLIDYTILSQSFYPTNIGTNYLAAFSPTNGGCTFRFDIYNGSNTSWNTNNIFWDIGVATNASLIFDWDRYLLKWRVGFLFGRSL